MLDGGIEPDPVFSVFHGFQYQNYSRLLLKIGVPPSPSRLRRAGRHQASERKAEDCVLRSEVFKNDGEEQKIILEDV